MSSVVSRWRARLRVRRGLLAKARKRHEAHPTSATRAVVEKRKRQVAFALRVLAHHAKHPTVRIRGNRVTGGTPRQRLKAAALHTAWLDSRGKRPSFYSQAGSWDVDHGITGEHAGERSDCSQFVTAMYKACGLPDPNGNDYRGGYTGTLGAHGVPVSRARLKPGDLVLYGPAPHHHVEMYVGPGDKTIGHGSRHVDAGSIYMMADPHLVTYPFLGS